MRSGVVRLERGSNRIAGVQAGQAFRSGAGMVLNGVE
jgi:hypothetical protein